MSSSSTMKAVVLRGPFNVKVEDVPIPHVQKPSDAVIRVHLAGLCGSDLHWYRGHEGDATGFVMGHEAVGTVVEVGEGMKNFKVGDRVVSPFHLSCGECYYCVRSYTSRCTQAKCIGGPGINGAQAEYLRVPLADSTLLPLPTDLPEEMMLLMTDILPTGYSVAMNARRMADEDREVEDAPGPGGSGDGKRRGVCVVIGCGPVGLCAITSATTLFSRVFATDLQAARLKLAEKHGAIALPLEQLRSALLDATEGRGADAALEVVGHPAALKTAMELVRPYGVVSSCGVHNMSIPIDGPTLYGKNLRFQFGRCSVRTFFPAALQVLRDHQELFSSFVEHRISFDEAEEYYRLFEQNKVSKTIFVMSSS